MTESESNEELLKILEAHGNDFLNSFSLTSTSRKRKRVAEEEKEEKEWCGIQMSPPSESEAENEDFEHSDDDFIADSSNVVIFSDQATNPKAERISKAQMRAFMSSKVAKITSDNATATHTEDKAENEDERSNAQNDALLHRLIHTQLLSGSLNPDLDLTSGQRKKAFAGRVLELAGAAKIGKGEKAVIEGERRKAAKSVREGLASKQKERKKQRLEEAKNLGNYHPTLKKVYESSSKPKPTRQRDRGLRMGVGRFSEGFLKLSREEIKVTENGQSGGSAGHRKRRTRHGRTQ